MQTTSSHAREACNYQKFWFFARNYTHYRRQHPYHTLLFSVGSYYIAFGIDARRILDNSRAESGDCPLFPSAIPDPLILERSELYRYVGIMSETSYPIKIFYDPVCPC
jgi:hypothetical protein